MMREWWLAETSFEQFVLSQDNQIFQNWYLNISKPPFDVDNMLMI